MLEYIRDHIIQTNDSKNFIISNRVFFARKLDPMSTWTHRSKMAAVFLFDVTGYKLVNMLYTLVFLISYRFILYIIKKNAFRILWRTKIIIYPMPILFSLSKSGFSNKIKTNKKRFLLQNVISHTWSNYRLICHGAMTWR